MLLQPVCLRSLLTVTLVAAKLSFRDVGQVEAPAITLVDVLRCGSR